MPDRDSEPYARIGDEARSRARERSKADFRVWLLTEMRALRRGDFVELVREIALAVPECVPWGELTGRAEPPFPHGTVAGARKHYGRKERPCRPCRWAAAADRNRRRKQVPAQPQSEVFALLEAARRKALKLTTAQRRQVVSVLDQQGWAVRDIARELDMDKRTVEGWTGKKRGPTRHEQVDEAMVQRAMDEGVPLMALSRAERREVVQRLTAKGWSADEIAERLSTSARIVKRWRKAEG